MILPEGKAKKFIKVVNIALELHEDGKAGIVFQCEDGRELALMVPPLDECSYSGSSPLSLFEVKGRDE